MSGLFDVPVPRRTVFGLGGGLAAALLLQACSIAPDSIDGVNRGATEFFERLLPGGSMDVAGVPTSLDALIRGAEAVVLGKVVDVVHSYSSKSADDSNELHTISLVVTGSVERGALRGNPSPLLIVGGTTSTSPEEFVDDQKKLMPTGSVLWFVSSFDSLAERRHEDLQRAGRTLDPDMLAEEAKLSGLFAAGPLGTIVQGSEHLEFPGLPKSFSDEALVREVATIAKLSTLVARVR